MCKSHIFFSSCQYSYGVACRLLGSHDILCVFISHSMRVISSLLFSEYTGYCKSVSIKILVIGVYVH